MSDHKTNLEVEAAEAPESWTSGCDGCGQVPQEGDLMVINIESCCGGGCTRAICAKCVDAAAKLIKEAETKFAGILSTGEKGDAPDGK